MGFIKEPDGVDFVINSRPLTKAEEVSISSYIQVYKAKHSQTKTAPRRTKKQVATRPTKKIVTQKKKVA
jgi:hypothetical protein